VEFFTFGGWLEAASVPGETFFSLCSPAPVLEVIEPPELITDQLAFETEAMIGEIQARWGSNDEGFARRLAQVDPFEFYLASLHSILLRYKQCQTMQEAFPDLYEMLLKEEGWLKETGQWPATPPRLERLLDPD
jgi:hypothetical protein